MARELKQDGKAYLKNLPVGDDPLGWLKGQALQGDTLLAHQDDGVVWGRAHQDGDWVTSSRISGYGYSPALRADRLWEARLFNETREILLWRDGERWSARQISEAGEDEPAFTEWFDEPQLLWGTGYQTRDVNGVAFALLEDGAQGMRHAPPVDLGASEGYQALEEERRVCLEVRHYLAREDVARVAASRLVKLSIHIEENKKEKEG